MWDKSNKQWVWLALDVKTREIVGVYIGARDSAALERIMEILTASKNDNAPLPTPIFGQLTPLCCQANDIEPSARKRALTSYIERFNNTLRQRVSRLVRKTLSFSKSLENHIGAIWYFIHHYNTSLLV
ncbi:IS1 family transposase [Microcoleus sp. Pol7_A1]|uniref:IS1 family transposase n=1 Tax=Microcoleus sp. Pol7_A1 TaxID=2818893 RepID=UPI002FD2874F